MDGEVEEDRAHVGQLAQAALHRTGRMLCPVRLTDGRVADFDVLHADGDLVVENVQFDQPTLIVLDQLVCSDADVAHDLLGA